MAPITSKTITGYLDQVKWQYRVVDDATVVTGFRAPVPFYSYVAPLEIKTGRHWVYLRSLLQRDIRAAYRPGVLRFLTRWNEHCHLVRFLLVHDCVVLQSEIPAVQCHVGAFVDALSAVCRYGSLTGVEISVLATSPSANALYEAAATALEASDGSWAAGGTPGADQIPDFDIIVNTMPD